MAEIIKHTPDPEIDFETQVKAMTNGLLLMATLDAHVTYMNKLAKNDSLPHDVYTSKRTYETLRGEMIRRMDQYASTKKGGN